MILRIDGKRHRLRVDLVAVINMACINAGLSRLPFGPCAQLYGHSRRISTDSTSLPAAGVDRLGQHYRCGFLPATRPFFFRRWMKRSVYTWCEPHRIISTVIVAIDCVRTRDRGPGGISSEDFPS